MSRTKIVCVVRTVVMIVVSSSSVHAIITVNESVDGEGDHLTTPGELAFGINVDGVGSLDIDGESVCTASLITSRHVMTAAHCLDWSEDGVITVGNGENDDLFADEVVTMRFELSTGDLSIPVDVMATVMASTTWFEESDDRDLAILTLAQNAPNSIPRYPIYGLFNEIGQHGVKVGYGLTGTGITGEFVDTGDKRAGLNTYETVGLAALDVAMTQLGYDFDNGLKAQNSLSRFGIESDLGFGDDEVNTAVGDSGGPTFIQGAVAGITSFGLSVDGDIDDWDNATFGELSFDTRVSTLSDFILLATDNEAVLLFLGGDFDGDGDVDGDDFLFWQIGFPTLTGASHMLGDADYDGDVDGEDFLIWQNNFPYPTAISAVPEPNSLAMLVLGSLLMHRRCRT